MSAGYDPSADKLAADEEATRLEAASPVIACVNRLLREFRGPADPRFAGVYTPSNDVLRPENEVLAWGLLARQVHDDAFRVLLPWAEGDEPLDRAVKKAEREGAEQAALWLSMMAASFRTVVAQHGCCAQCEGRALQLLGCAPRMEEAAPQHRCVACGFLIAMRIGKTAAAVAGAVSRIGPSLRSSRPQAKDPDAWEAAARVVETVFSDSDDLEPQLLPEQQRKMAGVLDIFRPAFYSVARSRGWDVKGLKFAGGRIKGKMWIPHPVDDPQEVSGNRIHKELRAWVAKARARSKAASAARGHVLVAGELDATALESWEDVAPGEASNSVRRIEWSPDLDRRLREAELARLCSDRVDDDLTDG